MCTVNITLSYSDSICSKTFWSSTSSVDLFAILQRLRLPCVPGYGGGSAWSGAGTAGRSQGGTWARRRQRYGVPVDHWVLVNSLD